MTTNDKISSVLATFNNDWKKKLDLFIKSPYFQVSENASKMITFYLLGNIKSIKKSEFDISIHRYLFPNVEFDLSKIQRLKSEALEIIKNFIIQQQVNTHSVYHTNLLLEYYLHNNLHNLFTFTYKQVIQKHESTPLNIGTSLDDEYSIKQTNSAFLSIQNVVKNSKTITQHNDLLMNLSYKLDILYYVKKLEQYGEILSTAELKIRNDITDKIREFLQVLDKKLYIREHPLVKIYYCVCCLKLNIDSEQHYDELILLLNEYKSTLQIVNIRTLYSHLLNYCTLQYNSGKKLFEIRLFQLYESLLTEGIIYDYSGKLSIDLYKNIIMVALRLKKTAWTEIFIEEQSKFLDEKYKIVVRDYGLALLAFYKKDYAKVQQILICLDSVNLFFDVKAKVLLLQNYYEKQDDNWETNVENFRIYIFRLQRDVTERKIKAYKNFHLMILNLFKLDKSQKQELLKLKEKIQTTLPLAEKKWLLEKVNEKIGDEQKE